MSKKRSIVLGIDPGTVVTGFGLLEAGEKIVPLEYGCLQPPTKEKLSDRYLYLFEGMQRLCRQYTPCAVAIESQYVGKNPTSALKLGMAKGVLLLGAKTLGIPVFAYTPSKAKQAITGKGSATKEEVMKMVRLVLRLEKEVLKEDTADALALAFCHVLSAKGALEL